MSGGKNGVLRGVRVRLPKLTGPANTVAGARNAAFTSPYSQPFGNWEKKQGLKALAATSEVGEGPRFLEVCRQLRKGSPRLSCHQAASASAPEAAVRPPSISIGENVEGNCLISQSPKQAVAD